MNPDFQSIGESFVQFYYGSFDNQATRGNVIQFYSGEALLTFEGEQCFGPEAIRQRLTEKFRMGSINRAITKVDCQPMGDGGVLVYVFGQLADSEAKGDKPIGFTHLFILKGQGEGSFCIANEVFRLALHDFATQ